MAYDDRLAERVRQALRSHKDVTEKKMFGGLSFLLHGKMCCGVLKDELVVRIQPKDYETALQQPHVRPMDFTGRPLNGFIYIAPAGCQSEQELARWVEHGVKFVSAISQSNAKQSATKKQKRSATKR